MDDNNPNFIVFSTDELLEEMKGIENRASLMASINALIATSILLFSGSQLQLNGSQKFYTLVIPIFFIVMSFLIYLSAIFLKQVRVMPWAYLKFLMSRQQHDYANDESKESLLNTHREVTSAYWRKTYINQYGSSFFAVGLFSLIFVNFVSTNFFNLENNSYKVPILLLIIGLLLAILLKLKLFTTDKISQTAGFKPDLTPRPPIIPVEVTNLVLQPRTGQDQDASGTVTVPEP